jgi:hypothetical protein
MGGSQWDTDDSSSASVDGATPGEDAEQYGPTMPPPAYLSLPESSGGMTDESNFWAGFGAIESQGVALRFGNNKFYFGTVISADDRDKTVSILFNDGTREHKVSITSDDDLVFFRGK